jgi:hypothetical protein
VSQSKIALVLLPAAVIVAVGLVTLRLYFQPPTVPAFAIAGAPAGSAGDAIPVAAGGSFEVELRPEAPVTGAIAARGFLLRGDEVRPWDPPFSVSADGTVRIAGPVDTLFAGVPAGAWEVAVAVGRPETLPTAPNDILRAREVDPRALSWRLVRERVFLRI